MDDSQYIVPIFVLLSSPSKCSVVNFKVVESPISQSNENLAPHAFISLKNYLVLIL
jgi:hypothetical protein